MQELDWFIVMVRPGFERAACAAVQRIGWEPFLPGYEKTVAKHSRQRGGKNKIPARERRLFVSWPGYLWIGGPGWLQRTDGWEQLLKLDLVTGVLMTQRDAGGGKWEAWPLQLPRTWRRWKELRNVEDIAFREALLGPAPAVDYKQGDDVLITHQVFFQFRAKCVFLDADSNVARVLVEMLGRQSQVTIPADAAMRQDDSETPAKPRRAKFDIGDAVEVLEGPFAGFPAVIDAIDGRQFTVTCQIFGRATPVVVDVKQLKRSRGVPVDDADRRSALGESGRS